LLVALDGVAVASIVMGASVVGGSKVLSDQFCVCCYCI